MQSLQVIPCRLLDGSVSWWSLSAISLDEEAAYESREPSLLYLSRLGLALALVLPSPNFPISLRSVCLPLRGYNTASFEARDSRPLEKLRHDDPLG
jgi:hypothetical protein